MPDFIPRMDSECRGWSANYVREVSADPARFFISLADAALLVSTQSAFATALQLARDPGTRTPVAIVAKNAARAAMEVVIRRSAGVVRSRMGSDRATLGVLGLCVGPGRDGRRSRIGPPKSAPSLFVAGVEGTVVSVHLHNTDALSRRGLARGIGGAIVFSFAGNVPPASADQWNWHCTTSTTDVAMQFGSSYPPGTMVWICAQWINPRQEPGPMSKPMNAYLGYAVNVQMAA